MYQTQPLMNVLFMNSARAWGGNEKWVRLAATALNRKSNVFLAYRKDIVGSRFTVPKIRLPFRHEADIETIVKLTLFVKKHDIEVLIPSKQKDYALAGLVSRACGCLNVLRLGIVRDLKKNPLSAFVFNKLADGIIVNAEPIKKKLLESGFREPERIRVIYNGIDHEEIIGLAEKQEIQLPFNFIVTAMGELSPRKGFDTLIRGFARFITHPSVQNAGVIIIGEGNLQKELQGLAKSLHIEKHVIFTGFLDNPYPFLSASNVFAMTSRNEGISNALLEAALLNNAIISTMAGGGIASVISEGKNGFLLEYGDEERLATLLLKLYANPELMKKTATEACRTVTKMFSLPQMTEEIISFCNDLQKSKKRQ